MTNIAIIPAAGFGKRFGGQSSKLFTPLGGQPILAWTLKAFEMATGVDHVILAIRPEDQEEIDQLVAEGGFRKVKQMVAGGQNRQESVSHALFHLKESPEIVVIHDAARPLVGSDMIAQAVEGARKFGAVVFGLPPTDTVKKMDAENRVQETLSRNTLRLIQTPEAFQLSIILQAHIEGAGNEVGAFDDAELVERSGRMVTILPGNPRNIKITTPEDLQLAESYLQGNVA